MPGVYVEKCCNEEMRYRSSCLDLSQRIASQIATRIGNHLGNLVSVDPGWGLQSKILHF